MRGIYELAEKVLASKKHSVPWSSFLYNTFQKPGPFSKRSNVLIIQQTTEKAQNKKCTLTNRTRSLELYTNE